MRTSHVDRVLVLSQVAVVVAGLASLAGCSSSSSAADGPGTPVDGGTFATPDTGPSAQPDSGGVDAGGQDGSADAQSDGGPVSVSISFDAHVGAATFSCAAGTTYPNLGTVPSIATISDFRFYVHDVSLVRDDGTTAPVVLTQDGVWQYENVALLDFEDGTGNCSDGTAPMNSVVRGTVAAGSYTGVTFKLDPTDGGVVSACANPNVAVVNLSGFDPTHDKIVADFAAVVAFSNLDVNGGGAPGCMSETTDPECPSVFQAFGLVLESGLPAKPPLQTAFRVE